MLISRRNFLKSAGGAVAGLVAASRDGEAVIDSPELRTKGLKSSA